MIYINYLIFLISFILGLILCIIFVKTKQKKYIKDTFSFSEQIDKRFNEIQQERNELKLKNKKIVLPNTINNNNKKKIIL